MGLFKKKEEREVLTEVDKNIANEKKQREKEIIVQEIFEIVSKYNDAFPNNKVDLDNIFIGKCVNKPGCIGCFWRDNGWFLYRVDDRFNLLANGPFSLNGIIVALLRMVYISSDFVNRKFDDAEYRLYLNGEKPL